MKPDLSMYEPLHRAMIEMAQRRAADPYEKAAIERLDLPSLIATLRESMRDDMCTIPAGTAIVTCRWCDARVCWVHLASKHYKSAIVVEREPTATARGQGYPHVADCPRSGLVVEEQRARQIAKHDVRKSA